MYLKGYRIIHANQKISEIRKNDFAGDTKHTYRAYLIMKNKLLNLTEEHFPIKIFDLDNEQFECKKNNQSGLLNWIRNEKK